MLSQDKNGHENSNHTEAIRKNILTEVIQKMCSYHYSISHDPEFPINDKCRQLFEKDYTCKVINNNNYCLNYPVGIIIPVGNKLDTERSSMDIDEVSYCKLVEGSYEVRRRNRFLAPVMLFDNKFICRSATLSVKLSTLHKLAAEKYPQTTYNDEDAFDILRENDVASTLFATDVEMLKYLKIENIYDLITKDDMICPLTSSAVLSEKSHADLYRDVKVEEIPYVASVYFSLYHNAGRNARGLFCDWKPEDVARQLKLSEDPKAFYPEINVNEDHKKWSLIQLTQNYLKIMLLHLMTGTGGMALHCLSGWDRTPIFISLLRLSLWADGVAHENLDFQDIAYLTVAYDWFLFGHKLPQRLQTKDELMHFCFNFLEYIISDEFSVTRLFQELPIEKKKNKVFPEFVPGRRTVLNKVRALILEIYDKEIIQKKKVQNAVS